MRQFIFIMAAMFISLSFIATNVVGQVAVPLGDWSEEGSGSVTGSGNTFTAFPVDAGIPDNGDNFAQRNAARHRVYQGLGELAFAEEGDTIEVSFDVTVFGDNPNENNDRDFRMSLLDTSTNQGFFAISFDIGGRSGTYTQSRFVDNIDGEVGDPFGGQFFNAINASGTITSTAAPPTESNGATELGLVDDNVLSFNVVYTRNAGDSFTTVLNVTEADGDVVYPEQVSTYDPVNPTVGDDSVANIAINSFDTIAFGLFRDNALDPNVEGFYTVSNLEILATVDVVLGDVNQDGIVNFFDIAPFIDLLAGEDFQAEADTNGDGTVNFFDISPFIDILAG